MACGGGVGRSSAAAGASMRGAEGGSASSLVHSSESVFEIHVDGVGRICPKRPQIVVCDQDPTMRYPASCDAYGCECCGPRKALQSAALAAWGIRHADRGRFLTLTLAPDDWQQRRQKMRNLKRYLGQRGLRCEWAWATEKGSKTGMVHVHALQHGDYVPQRLLQDVWGARVDIRKIETGGVARYVTKDALKVAGYTVKGTRAELGAGAMQEALELNGGRPLHWSRGFLHGQTRRDALAALRAELAEGPALTWHLEPVLWPALDTEPVVTQAEYQGVWADGQV